MSDNVFERNEEYNSQLRKLYRVATGELLNRSVVLVEQEVAVMNNVLSHRKLYSVDK